MLLPVKEKVGGLNPSNADAADTLFAADLTIMEEGSELIHRIQHHLEAHPASDEPMPMFTSCCPGWVGEWAAASRQAH